MRRSTGPATTGSHSTSPDDLALLVTEIFDALDQQNFTEIAELITRNMAAVWLALRPAQLLELLETVMPRLQNPPPLLDAAHRILAASTADLSHTQQLANSLDVSDPEQMFVLSMFRMTDFRIHGQIHHAMDQADNIEQCIEQLLPKLNRRGGWLLQSTVQLGTTAMLAGDFSRALSCFLRGQIFRATPKYLVLQREAIVKSALIHACFGNATTAAGLIKRATKLEHTSSWLEQHMDTYLEFIRVLHGWDDPTEAIDRLEAISLHDIGEMWPFYVVAVHRAFEAAGYHDELEHRLEMFDALPLPRIDGEGFTGSVLPLKRAMVALSVGRGSEALRFLERADRRLTYTKIVSAATNLYVGRMQQAIDQAHELHKETRSFRLMEIRRLSILSAAQFMLGDTEESLNTLRWAAALPSGLNPIETQLFSRDIRQLAEQSVESWPKTSASNGIFLSDLPKAGHSLTGREIEVLEHLAQGCSRAEIADRLFVSLSTVKTQLNSIYRKLDASSASEAILEGERRGII